MKGKRERNLQSTVADSVGQFILTTKFVCAVWLVHGDGDDNQAGCGVGAASLLRTRYASTGTGWQT